jgi:hypothetical protein
MNDPLSWRRLGGGTAATFLVIGAFLAGRLHSGDDPAVGSAQANTTSSTSASQGTTTSTFTDQNPPTTGAS